MPDNTHNVRRKIQGEPRPAQARQGYGDKPRQPLRLLFGTNIEDRPQKEGQRRDAQDKGKQLTA